MEEFVKGFEEVQIGNLEDIKEQKTVIPPTKNVRVKIVKAENAVNKDNTYRSINLQLKMLDGIGEEGKYKGKILFARVCYYADPKVYTKDFFTSRQHLISLKFLAKATGVACAVVNQNTLDQLLSAPEMTVDIITRKRVMLVDGVQEVTLENDVRNFKALDPTTLF